MYRPPLKLKLTDRERGYYSNMWSLAAKTDPNKVQGPEAVEFFKKSGQPIETLKNIWRVAARTDPAYLTKEEFYIAIRLIAYA